MNKGLFEYGSPLKIRGPGGAIYLPFLVLCTPRCLVYSDGTRSVVYYVVCLQASKHDTRGKLALTMPLGSWDGRTRVACIIYDPVIDQDSLQEPPPPPPHLAQLKDTPWDQKMVDC